MRTNTNLHQVSIADMISIQHTIPRIQLSLVTVQQAAQMTGFKLKIGRIETDYSWPMIQACLKIFNDMNIKMYVNACFQIITTENQQLDFTILHLCSAHLFKDYKAD